MDDFNISTLQGSKNEWCCYLLQILTPLVMDGYKSIMKESITICEKNGEYEKYLMTFQNFISRIPKWNPNIIETEVNRIIEKSGCSYLEDLITCVHIIQLKMITAMRVGQKQKKINISVPKLNNFIHKVYINAARKLYKNIYLYEVNIPPLQSQKNNREIELIIQSAILESVRESIPIEDFLKIYLDETEETDVAEEVKEEIIDEPIEPANISEPEIPKIDGNKDISNSHSSTGVSSTDVSSIGVSSSEDLSNGVSIKFNDIDSVKDVNNVESQIDAPKTIDRLEQISEERNLLRKQEEEEDENVNDKIQIMDDNIKLDDLDIHDLSEPSSSINIMPDLLVDDFEILN